MLYIRINDVGKVRIVIPSDLHKFFCYSRRPLMSNEMLKIRMWILVCLPF